MTLKLTHSLTSKPSPQNHIIEKEKKEKKDVKEHTDVKLSFLMMARSICKKIMIRPRLELETFSGPNRVNVRLT